MSFLYQLFIYNKRSQICMFDPFFLDTFTRNFVTKVINIEYNKIWCKFFPDWKTNGVPTVRSDLPAPRIRRIGDSTVSFIFVVSLFMFYHILNIIKTFDVISRLEDNFIIRIYIHKAAADFGRSHNGLFYLKIIWLTIARETREISQLVFLIRAIFLWNR